MWCLNKTKKKSSFEQNLLIEIECFDLYFLVRRTDSIQSRRKVSSISDRSDTSEPGAASGGEESPGILR